jgi:hypothetical protein
MVWNHFSVAVVASLVFFLWAGVGPPSLVKAQSDPIKLGLCDMLKGQPIYRQYRLASFCEARVKSFDGSSQVRIEFKSKKVDKLKKLIATLFPFGSKYKFPLCCTTKTIFCSLNCSIVFSTMTTTKSRRVVEVSTSFEHPCQRFKIRIGQASGPTGQQQLQQSAL